MIRPRIAILNNNGTTDTAFDPGAGLNAAGRAVAVLPSGKILAGGDFTEVDGMVRSRLVLLNADGSLDAAAPEADGPVRCIVPQIDGRAVVGGAFTQCGGLVRGRLARLLDGGVVDAAFSPACNGLVNAVALDADGRVMVAGAFTAVGSTGRNRVARLYNDEAATDLRVVSAAMVTWQRTGAGQESVRVTFDLDTGSGYAPLGGVLARTPGGWQVSGLSLSGAGSIRARAFPADGHSSGVIEEVHAFDFVPVIQVSLEEVILGTGDALAYEASQIGQLQTRTLVVTNVGLTDLEFGETPTVISGTGGAQWNVPEAPAAALAPGESMELALDFTPAEEGGQSALFELVTNDAGSPFELMLSGAGVPGPGSVDRAFQMTLLGGTVNSSPTAVRALAVPATGLFMGGSFATVNSLNRRGYAQVSEAGVVAVQTGNGVNMTGIFAAVQLPDGKWMIGGTFTRVNGAVKSRLARLNADGTLDTAFKVTANGDVYCLLVQEDGGVIVGGGFAKLGGENRNRLGRITPSGLVDAGWNPSPDGVVQTLATQPDGKIYVGGGFYSIAGALRRSVARLNANGSLDSGFDAQFTGTGSVDHLAVDAAGQVLLRRRLSTTTSGTFLRVADDGVPDEVFIPAAANVYGFCLQADGRLVVAERMQVRRLLESGSEDESFIGDYEGTVIQTLALARTGAVLVGSSSLTRLVNDLDAASSVLSVDSAASIQWLRGGTLPEAQYVVFDLSEDGGSTWMRLGKGTRTAGGWSLATSLPTAGQVRGRAYVGTSSGSAAFQDEVTLFSGLIAPDLQVEVPTGTVIGNGGDLVFPGTIPNQNTSLTLTLRNTGLAAVSNLALQSTQAEWTVSSLGLTALAPNQVTTAVIRFTPSSTTGYKTGVLNLTSNVPGLKNPYVLKLAGASVKAPTAITNGETHVTSSSVMLKGRVRPNHDTATAFFQYKRRADNAWITVGTSQVSGFDVVLLSHNLAGLMPGTDYHYRMGVYNSVNTAAAPDYGALNAFTTLLP